MFSDVQVSVVDLWSDPQDVTHEGVDVHRLKGSHLQVLVKCWTHCPEESLHVQLLVVEAVLAFVELNREILQGDKDKDSMTEFGSVGGQDGSMWLTDFVLVVGSFSDKLSYQMPSTKILKSNI